MPEQQLGVLGDVRGLDVVELGCGTAYFSAWLAQRGARPIGVDVTPAQLESARRCQDRFGISFPFIEADAAKVPLPSSHFDLPSPNAAPACGATRPAGYPRLPGCYDQGGRLVFHTTTLLVTVCSPGTGRARPPRTLLPATPGTPPGDVAVRYPVPPRHGEWIKILRGSGFLIDALHELYAPPDAPDHPYYTLASAEWARQWAAEEIWVTHLAG